MNAAGLPQEAVAMRNEASRGRRSRAKALDHFRSGFASAAFRLALMN